MTPRVLRPAITLTTAVAILMTAVAAYAFLAAGTTQAAPTFDPVTVVKFCNDLPPSFPPDGTLAGAGGACPEYEPFLGLITNENPDVSTILEIPSGDLNFASVVTLTPNGQSISPNGGLAAIAVGTKMGGLHSETRLGTLNQPCNILFPVDFVFFNVALPANTGIPRVDASTNVVYPYPEGTSVRFGAWKLGSPPDPNEPTGLVTDPGGQAVVTGGFGATIANGTTASIQNYPSHLLRVFDTDTPPLVPGGADSLRPSAVYGGLTKVAGTEWVPLYLAQFNAGGLASLGAPLSSLVTAMGQPSVSVLNDPSALVASPSTITDFCTPLKVTAMLLGTPSTARIRNPAVAGTIHYMHYLASLRDKDEDGYENALDTCPLDVNDDIDDDNDGIDFSCDDDDTAGDDNFDTDDFVNREDNCPQDDNQSQLDSEIIQGPAADEGPRTDQIGDVCDADDIVANGLYRTVTKDFTKCIESSLPIDEDNDPPSVNPYNLHGDGDCEAGDPADSGVCATQSPPSCFSRHSPWTGATHPGLQMDTDADKQSDALETYVGTDPVQSCSVNIGTNNEPFDNWMFDLNDNQSVSGQDSGPFGGAGGGFNKNVVNGPFNGRPGVRYDFNNDGVINSQDTGKFGGVGPYGGTGPFNKTCATAGIPPFFQQ